MMEELFRLFQEHGHQLYLVGGCVRDRLLGRATEDIDLATDAIPEVAMQLLRDGGFRPYPLGMEFGTVAATVGIPSGPVDVQITTFRCSESYRKGSRHPEVVFGGSLEEDLVRRDFTVNAMAMDINGGLIDPLGGRRDLEKRIIRTPRDPEETFAEDPLRMLRAFRFACVLGFSIEEKTLEAISGKHCLIMDISRERWKMEMDRLLSAPDPAVVSRTLCLMRSSGLLEEMIPEFREVFAQEDLPRGRAHSGDIWEHTLSAMSSAPSEALCLRWSLLLHDIGKPSCRSEDDRGEPHFHGHEIRSAEIADGIADRFRFSKRDRKCLIFLVRNHMRPVLYSRDWSDRAVRKLAVDAGDHLEELLDLAQADIRAHAEPFASEGTAGLSELRKRLLELAPDARRRVLPRELGTILMNRVGSDIAGTPQIGVILSNLEELVHQGVLPEMAEPEVYLEYLDQHPGSICRNC